MVNQICLGSTVLRIVHALPNSSQWAPTHPVRLHECQCVHIRAALGHPCRCDWCASVCGRDAGLCTAVPFAYIIFLDLCSRVHLAVGNGRVYGLQVVQSEGWLWNSWQTYWPRRTSSTASAETPCTCYYDGCTAETTVAATATTSRAAVNHSHTATTTTTSKSEFKSTTFHASTYQTKTSKQTDIACSDRPGHERTHKWCANCSHQRA